MIKLKNYLLIVFSVFFITGCDNQIENLEGRNEINHTENTSIVNKSVSNQRLLNDEQVKLVGEKHNQVLTQVFSNYDFNTNDRVYEIRAQFEKVDLNGHIINWNSKDYGNIENNLNFLRNNLSENAFSIIEQGMSEAENLENFDSFSNKLESLNLKARKELVGIELDTVLIALNVLENSAKLWLPIEEGGNGIGYGFMEKYNSLYNTEINNRRSPRQMIRTALAADGLSAAGGFLVGAFVIGATAGTGGLGTAAIVGFLVGVAGEAAIASGVAIGINIG